jgi:hypothetical protein
MSRRPHRFPRPFVLLRWFDTTDMFERGNRRPPAESML